MHRHPDADSRTRAGRPPDTQHAERTLTIHPLASTPALDLNPSPSIFMRPDLLSACCGPARERDPRREDSGAVVIWSAA